MSSEEEAAAATLLLSTGVSHMMKSTKLDIFAHENETRADTWQRRRVRSTGKVKEKNRCRLIFVRNFHRVAAAAAALVKTDLGLRCSSQENSVSFLIYLSVMVLAWQTTHAATAAATDAAVHQEKTWHEHVQISFSLLNLLTSLSSY